LKIKTELEDINEDEVTYDSDGKLGRGESPGRVVSSAGSVGSAGSGASSGSGSRGRRRTWRKPKDKPKRPLSGYNIFFKHERSRIVEGREDDPGPQEIVRSIETILSTSRETRRHRKSHGKISFGDLARKIAEKWKTVDKERKKVFEHYAEIDTRRYRKELQIWKDRKEAQASSSSMHNSVSSLDGGVEDENELSLHDLGPSNHSRGGHNSSSEAWGARYSMNSSFSSIDSAEVSLEPIPIHEMMRNKSNHHSGSMSHSMSTMSGSGSGGSFPNLGMEVGIPVQGSVSSNSFSQLNMNALPNMQLMQNLQPNEIALFNQQQHLLNSMQCGNNNNTMGQQLGQMGRQQMGQSGQMGQPGQMGQQQNQHQAGQMGQQQNQQQMNVAPLDLQQQRQSLEQQRQQLLLLQQQQQILQQQLIQQQNSLRIQQGNLAQQQATFVQQQQQGQPDDNSNMGAQPPLTVSNGNIGQANGMRRGSGMSELMTLNNLDLSNVQ